jgi:ubiquinone/menaquinone biosynthesis C-methylase UbiE
MDKVICGFGLFFLPDIDKGLSEIRRVLKDNGVLIFSSWNDEYRLRWLDDVLMKYLPESLNRFSKAGDKIEGTDFNTRNRKIAEQKRV